MGGDTVRGGGDRAASIQDVSRAAGVSTATVSHVLNRTRYVSPALQQRVLEAVGHLDYRANGLARSLRTRRTSTLGLVIPDLANPYYPQLARGVQDAAAAAGYTVLICSTDAAAAEEARVLAVLGQRHVDGVLLEAGGPSAAVASAIKRARHPIVFIGARVDVPHLDAVQMVPDGGYSVTRHLIEQGHRRIALVGGRPEPGTDEPAKAEGYRRAHRDAGLPVDPGCIIRGRLTRERGLEATRALLALPRRPTAVIGANDLVAIGALFAAHEAGVRVPDDLAVAGHDDIPEAACTYPPLTTLAVPKYQIGHAAAELLLARISGRGPEGPQRIRLAHHLVVRASSSKLEAAGVAT